MMCGSRMMQKDRHAMMMVGMYMGVRSGVFENLFINESNLGTCHNIRDRSSFGSQACGNDAFT